MEQDVSPTTTRLSLQVARERWTVTLELPHAVRKYGEDRASCSIEGLQRTDRIGEGPSIFLAGTTQTLPLQLKLHLFSLPIVDGSGEPTNGLEDNASLIDLVKY